MATLRASPVIVVAAILHILVGLSWGRYVVEQKSIKIVNPHHLRGTYASAIFSKHVGSIVGSVVHPAEGEMGCLPFNITQDWSKQSVGRGLPVFFLVDRGSCFYALKVFNAQQAGAAAVLISDDRHEELISMDSSDDGHYTGDYRDKITIPSILIQKDLGVKMKKYLNTGKGTLVIQLDSSLPLPHPDEHFEDELETNSIDKCGPKCGAQVDSVQHFKGAAQIPGQGKYSHFTPHYVPSSCPQPFIHSTQCRSQCINHGRYCAPVCSQSGEFEIHYDGRDVVVANLRHLCVHKVSKDTGRLQAWSDYVRYFQFRCPMYRDLCAEQLAYLRLPVAEVRECMGDPEADAENPILEAQVRHGERVDVTTLLLSKGNRNLDEYVQLQRDGMGGYVGINEYSGKVACPCPEGVHRNKWDGVNCQCPGNVYKKTRYMSSESKVGWWISLVVVAGVVAIALGGYVVYKYRTQSSEESEIRAILAQYMPLDSQGEMSHEHNTSP